MRSWKRGGMSLHRNCGKTENLGLEQQRTIATTQCHPEVQAESSKMQGRTAAMPRTHWPSNCNGHSNRAAHGFAQETWFHNHGDFTLALGYGAHIAIFKLLDGRASPQSARFTIRKALGNDSGPKVRNPGFGIKRRQGTRTHLYLSGGTFAAHQPGFSQVVFAGQTGSFSSVRVPGKGCAGVFGSAAECYRHWV